MTKAPTPTEMSKGQSDKNQYYNQMNDEMLLWFRKVEFFYCLFNFTLVVNTTPFTILNVIPILCKAQIMDYG